MEQEFNSIQATVMGPNGRWLSLADLPAPDTKRWVPRRKAEVVAAVRGGILSLDDACARYALTVEEFLSWQRNVERYGLRGLRATQAHRTASEQRSTATAEHRPHA
ncbi:MAG: DUF1153 domain-containing protein [Proteobacteria bacterium]|nr:DUF1153 domain-containing protein [Pseudomonadota bacterium]